jgi:NAD(P)-dependent dehydrogenase (short-subunit alcohol dehydrogenase family)
MLAPLPRPFTGQHALVTGGGRGIGAAIADALAARGAAVTLVGRTAATLAEAKARLVAAHAVPVHAEAADVTDPAAVAAAFKGAAAAQGPVSILVNNAGRGESQPFKRMDLAFLRRMLDINLVSAVLCTQAALEGMIARGAGRIVNVASTAGLVGYRYVSAYVAAKHAVIGLTRALALETAKTGVTVNAVCPSYVETDMTADTVANIVAKTGKSAAEARASLAAANPQGRLIQPDEVASAVCWLCLPDSGSITGQAIAIAGGEVM